MHHPKLFLAVAAAGLAFLAGAYLGGESTRCPEDAVLAWYGGVGDRRVCVSVDDFADPAALDGVLEQIADDTRSAR